MYNKIVLCVLSLTYCSQSSSSCRRMPPFLRSCPICFIICKMLQWLLHKRNKQKVHTQPIFQNHYLYYIALLAYIFRIDSINSQTHTAIKRAHNTIQKRRTRTGGGAGYECGRGRHTRNQFCGISQREHKTHTQPNAATNERTLCRDTSSDPIHVLILMALHDTERPWSYGATQSSNPIIPTKHSPDGRIFAASWSCFSGGFSWLCSGCCVEEEGWLKCPSTI